MPERREDFTDLISGKIVTLVIPDDGRVFPTGDEPKIGIAHPDCDRLADISVEVDAFYCPTCRWNGRVSGGWVVDRIHAPDRETATALARTRLAELVATRTGVGTETAERILDVGCTVGAVARPEDLLPGGLGCLPLWAELAEKLTARGWHGEVCWGPENEGTFVFLPEGKTYAEYDGLACDWMTVEHYGDGNLVVRRGWPAPPGDLQEPCWESWPSVDQAVLALGG